MTALVQNLSINWKCRHTWLRASKNTMWCLLGCSIGDFGTIAFFQFTDIPWPTLAIMTLAIINVLTSIALETDYSVASNESKARFQYRDWNVHYFHGFNGSRDEYCGRVIDRWGHADVVGGTDHAFGRLFDPAAI